MVSRDFIENLVNLEAMALGFKTLLSLAPLLAVIFSILKGFWRAQSHGAGSCRGARPP